MLNQTNRWQEFPFSPLVIFRFIDFAVLSPCVEIYKLKTFLASKTLRGKITKLFFFFFCCSSSTNGSFCKLFVFSRIAGFPWFFLLWFSRIWEFLHICVFFRLPLVHQNVLVVLYSSIAIFGITANIAILFAFFRNKVDPFYGI